MQHQMQHQMQKQSRVDQNGLCLQWKANNQCRLGNDCPFSHDDVQPPSHYICKICNIGGHWLKNCDLNNNLVKKSYGQGQVTGKGRRRPDASYVCKKCNEKGHWLKDCNQYEKNNNYKNNNYKNNNYNKNNNNNNKTNQTIVQRRTRPFVRPKQACWAWKQGNCTKGDECPAAHVGIGGRKKNVQNDELPEEKKEKVQKKEKEKNQEQEQKKEKVNDVIGGGASVKNMYGSYQKKQQELEEAKKISMETSWDVAGKGGKSKRNKRRAKNKVQRFVHRDRGVNVLEGLALHRNIIDTTFETELIQYLEQTIAAGDKGYLLGETFMQSTFNDPVTGRRGKGRQVLQYGAFKI